MRNLWNKLNRFLRGESFLHIVTMFTILTVLMQGTLLLGIYLPTWSLAVLTVVIAILWEVGGKILEQKPINFGDIVWGLVGGLISILIFKTL